MKLSVAWRRLARYSLVAITVGIVSFSLVVVDTASAQFGIPHHSKRKPPAQTGPAPYTMPTMPGAPQVNAPGVPMAADSPVYTSYKLLQAQGSYRIVITMQAAGPQMAQAAAEGFVIKSIQTDVKGDVHRSVMHWSMPASDARGRFMPGVIDDWEATGVVQNGMSARRLYSPTGTPRILVMDAAEAAQQLAMYDQMMGAAVVRQAAEGPIGMAVAAMDVGLIAATHVEVAATLKKARDFFSWRCEPQAQSTAQQTLPGLTDLTVVGDDTINGVAVSKYDFYVRDGGKLNGPVHLTVAKDSGLPMRLEMTDPGGMGSMTMDYDTTTPVDIEIPPCMAGSH
jgi:hypothetical protein